MKNIVGAPVYGDNFINREKELKTAVRLMHNGNSFLLLGIRRHLLIFGPRGMGKSFFLKYLSIKFKANPVFEHSDFVSLPEEQSNIKCTTDLLKMILAYLKENSFENVTAIWEETEEIWEEHLKLLINVIKQKQQQFPNFSLVVVMENINEFLDKLRSEKKQAKIKEARFSCGKQPLYSYFK